jgi:hypothetical protein
MRATFKLDYCVSLKSPVTLAWVEVLSLISRP